MVRLSEGTRKLLKDDIVSVLYEKAPLSVFGNVIAKELRRDKEFVKGMLLELEKMGVVERVVKGFSGRRYTKRLKWRIPSQVLQAMQKSR